MTTRNPLLICLLAALWLVPGALAATPPAAETPVWPLDLPTRYLTSNFMEHRSGRFHAGLDFKTDERPGHPVRAVVDGWISRIRFTPGGYGKALYLRGDDGLIYVYAHLERLADPWRRLVERTQRRRDRWDVALYFPAGKHTVRAGDVLALSGQSGTSGPHLHFEVRDSANRPMDPQVHGFAVADTIAPRLLRVRAIPAAPGATVAGGTFARSFGDGRSPLPARLDGLRIRGAVAFTCRVVEQSDIRGHRLEPWRLALSVDDSLVFEARNETYAFAHNDRSRLMWLGTDGGRERWLHVRPGNDLAGRLGAAWWADPAVMTPGAHALRLVAEDRAGNRAETSWTVHVDAGDGPPTWDEAPLRVTMDPPVEGVAWLSPLLAGRADGAVIPADTLARELERPVCAVVDSAGFETGEVAKMGKVQGLAPLLELQRGVLRVQAADWPVAESLEVATSWTDTLPPHTGLYVSTSRGWRLSGPARRSDAPLEAWRVELPGPGRFALLSDGSAPYLGPGPAEGIVRPGEAAVVPAVTERPWETVPVRLEDLGSGIDAASIAATWDGAPLIVEPDLPRRRVLVAVPDDAPAGLHTLTLSAADRSGREIERVYELRLVPE